MADRFEDERGVIQDLLGVPLDSVTCIFTKAGAVRGNHIHHKTTQWVYMVSGTMLVSHDGVETMHYPDEFFTEPPGVPHAWRAETDCRVLVFTAGPRSGENYESDTERLPKEEWLLNVEVCDACHKPGDLATTAGGRRVHMSCPVGGGNG